MTTHHTSAYVSGNFIMPFSGNGSSGNKPPKYGTILSAYNTRMNYNTVEPSTTDTIGIGASKHVLLMQISLVKQ